MFAVTPRPHAASLASPCLASKPMSEAGGGEAEPARGGCDGDFGVIISPSQTLQLEEAAAISPSQTRWRIGCDGDFAESHLRFLRVNLDAADRRRRRFLRARCGGGDFSESHLGVFAIGGVVVARRGQTVAAPRRRGGCVLSRVPVPHTDQHTPGPSASGPVCRGRRMCLDRCNW